MKHFRCYVAYAAAGIAVTLAARIDEDDTKDNAVVEELENDQVLEGDIRDSYYVEAIADEMELATLEENGTESVMENQARCMNSWKPGWERYNPDKACQLWSTNAEWGARSTYGQNLGSLEKSCCIDWAKKNCPKICGCSYNEKCAKVCPPQHFKGKRLSVTQQSTLHGAGSRYTYIVTIGGSITQKDANRGTHIATVGKHKSYNGMVESFGSGDRCGSTPRSAKVTYTYGDTLKLLKASEPSLCVYRFEVQLPKQYCSVLR